MKTLRILTAAILTVVFTAGAMAENKTEAFTIEVADLGTNQESTYTLSDASLSSPLTVSVKHYANGSNYMVEGNGFELLYRVRGDRFGVAYVDEADAKVGKDEMYKKLDRQAFLHQYVITDQPKSESEYMELIAAYLPAVMK